MIPASEPFIQRRRQRPMLHGSAMMQGNTRTHLERSPPLRTLRGHMLVEPTPYRMQRIPPPFESHPARRQRQLPGCGGDGRPCEPIDSSEKESTVFCFRGKRVDRGTRRGSNREKRSAMRYRRCQRSMLREINAATTAPTEMDAGVEQSTFRRG